MKDKRPSWDDYFIELAQIVKKRSNCLRPPYGALIVKDFRILSSGYNGTPHGIKNCFAGGCERCARRQKGEIQTHEYQESCICIHAEQNAIIQAAYQGSSTKGATMYSTISPCSSCAKMIINAGIMRYVYHQLHHDTEGIKLLKSASVNVNKYSK
ncbi:cytidine/deoxycytidylate deaminase family protein [Candidatus Roizmanbacteria bacterium]|nr:cytidine/deoxycytidylate deaminase family protein [Candidatus Roizmanbacteria bacterium]